MPLCILNNCQRYPNLDYCNFAQDLFCLVKLFEIRGRHRLILSEMAALVVYSLEYMNIRGGIAVDTGVLLRTSFSLFVCEMHTLSCFAHVVKHLFLFMGGHLLPWL